MSFMNIKNLEKRDVMIEDYLALKKRLQERSLEERSDLVDRQRDLEENFKPIVASNQRMAEVIVNDLIPIKKELKEINRNIGISKEEDFGASPQKRFKATAVAEAAMTPTLTPRQRTLKIGVTAAKYFKHALNNNTNDNIFGFLFKDEDSQNINNLMIGDKDVHFLAGDDFRIRNRIYHGTPGLYELITFKDPAQYTEEDLANYASIVKQTHVLYKDNNPTNVHRWNKSNKWKYILKPIWEEIQEEEEEEQSVQPRRLFDDVGGSGLYLHKSGHCVKVEAVKGNGLYLTPHSRLAGVYGDGLYLKRGSSIYDGRGLLLGPQSPFKNIPILKWIL